MIDLPDAIYPTSDQQLTPDVRVDNHGTIYLVRPVSGRAAWWIDEHVRKEFQWFGGSLVLEHRYARDLIELMREAGLLIKVQPSTLPSGDQDAPERPRYVLLAVLLPKTNLRGGSKNRGPITCLPKAGTWVRISPSPPTSLQVWNSLELPGEIP
jgi:hypothetical protein